MQLDPNEIGVPSSSYTLSIDDTAGDNINGGSPLTGTAIAKNHINRVFYFFLNEGEVFRLSHGSADTLQDATPSDTTATIKIFPG